jgi:hypothetical protein
MNSDDELKGWLTMIGIYLVVGLIFAGYVIRAMAGAWWVELGALIAAVAGPYLLENRIIEELRLKQPEELISGALRANSIQFLVKPKAMQTQLQYAKRFGIGLSLVIFVFGWIILVSHADGGRNFPYYPLAIMGLAIELFAAHFYDNWRTSAKAEKFRDAIETHIVGIAGTKSIELDLPRAEAALQQIATAAQELHHQPPVQYRDEFNRLINRHLQEILEKRGKVSKQFKDEFNTLTADAEAYAKHIVTAQRLVTNMTGLYGHVIATIQYVDSSSLLVELHQAYNPQKVTKTIHQLLDSGEWGKLAKLTASLTKAIESIRDKIPHRQWQQSQQKTESSNSGGEQTQASSAPKYTVDEAYKFFGLPYGTPEDLVKKIYRRKAMKTHPDRGGKKEDFIQVNAAYEVIKEYLKLT